MEVKIKKVVKYNAKQLQIRAGVRYWEDASVNGEEDTNGDLIPCRLGENWIPIIDVDNGIILNWDKGKTASIHYKVCDDFDCKLYDENEELILEYDGYVPDFLSINDKGYGDYIILDVEENGKITNFKFNIKDIL